MWKKINISFVTISKDKTQNNKINTIENEVEEEKYRITTMASILLKLNNVCRKYHIDFDIIKFTAHLIKAVIYVVTQ